MKILQNNLISLVAIGGGIYLAANGQEGWGWFLFVGLLVTSFPFDDKQE